MTEDEKKKLEEELAYFTIYKRVFCSPDGELLLEHLKKSCHFNTSTIRGDELRDLSQWREGRRSVVCDILAIKALDLDRYRKQQIKNRKSKEEENDDSWVFQA